MTDERRQAAELARRVLDRPNADPDDDLAILARQLGRALRRERVLRALLGNIWSRWPVGVFSEELLAAVESALGDVGP